MIVVTVTYSYELDISLEEWDALSEATRWNHLAGITSPDTCDMAAETL